MVQDVSTVIVHLALLPLPPLPGLFTSGSSPLPLLNWLQIGDLVLALLKHVIRQQQQRDRPRLARMAAEVRGESPKSPQWGLQTL